MIVINSGKMTIPEEERFIGFVGDNLHSQKQFILTDVSDEDCIYRLYLTFDDGTANYLVLDSKVENGSTILDWTITQDDIYKSGVVNAQIKAFLADGEVYHTSSDYFYVEDSAEFATEFTEKENAEFLRYEAKLNSILSEIKSSGYNLVPATRTIAGVDLADDITVKELFEALSAYFENGEELNLSNYVKKTLTLAGMNLTTDRTVEDFQTALGTFPVLNLGSVEPTLKTVGKAGQFGMRTTYDGKTYVRYLYYCSSVTDTAYNWVLIACSDATGADGYTPKKGIDYFTDEDKAELVDNVLAQVESDNGIPDYWQSALDEGVQAIRRAMESAGQNKSAFFFYSDSHWSNETTYTSKMAPTLLKYLYNKTSINQTNFGGDIVSAESSDSDTMAYLWEWRERLRGLPNHHSVIGNHDDGNTTNNLFSKNYIYSYLFAPEESSDIVWGNGFYYYIDNNSEKTRYLYLDTMYEGVTNTQLSFVKEALKGVKDGWHIVVITHAWFDNDYSVYPPVIGGFSNDAQKLLTEFDNYNSRIADFAECGGWVEFCIGGHYHLDYYATSSTGIPVILVEADTFHDRGGTMPKHGTTDEASVNAIVADYNANTVNIIRIGRGESREIKVTTTIVNYTNVIPLSIGADGEIFNDGQGWAANSRIGSGTLDNYIGGGSYYITGHIAIDPNIDNVIRLKNVTLTGGSTSNSSLGIAFYDSSFTRVNYNDAYSWLSAGSMNGADATSSVLDGTNVVEFTLYASNVTNKDVAYIALCTEYIGTDSIITINEPIE